MLSNLSSNFKKTDIGLIPEDWNVIRLDSITELITKGTTPTTYGFNYEDKGINFVKVESIDEQGNLNPNKFSKISMEAHEKLSRSQIQNGDMLLSIAGALGRVTIATKDILPANTNQAVSIVRFHEGIDNRFVYYAIKSHIVDKQIKEVSTIGAQPNLSLKQVGDFLIPFPTKQEQRKIADILTSVDNDIEKTEAIITQTEVVKQGLMQQLLTKGIGYTKFKQTEIGEIPTDWEVINLGDVAKLQGGYAFKSKDGTLEGIRWLKIANVGVDGVKWDDVSYLPTEFLKLHSDFVLDKNDIVMAMTRPVLGNSLKVARLNKTDVPSLLNQRVGRFKLTGKINDEFLLQLTKSTYFVSQIQLKIRGTDPPNISSKQVESILIPLPNLEEQKKIASILKSLDERVQRETEYKNKLESLKSSLMQNLLTGKVRVNVDESSEVSV